MFPLAEWSLQQLLHSSMFMYLIQHWQEHHPPSQTTKAEPVRQSIVSNIPKWTSMTKQWSTITEMRSSSTKTDKDIIYQQGSHMELNHLHCLRLSLRRDILRCLKIFIVVCTTSWYFYGPRESKNANLPKQNCLIIPWCFHLLIIFVRDLQHPFSLYSGLALSVGTLDIFHWQ